MLEVTLLGTAATCPRPDHAVTAAAISCKGRTLLLDCGEGTQVALHRWGVNPMRIDLICLTHYHGDHIFGLPGLLQSMGTLGRTAPLTITGPEGLEDAMAPILLLTEEQPFPIRLLEMPKEGLHLSTLDGRWPTAAVLTVFPTVHRVVSQGYRFHLGRRGRFLASQAEALGVPKYLWRHLQNGKPAELPGRGVIQPEAVCGPARPGLTVVFSGDTMPCEALEQAAAGADLLLMDATYPTEDQADKAALYGHSTFPQAAALAARAGAKELWLVHFSASIEDPEAYRPAAQQIFPQTRCGHDGMAATLVFRKEE